MIILRIPQPLHLAMRSDLRRPHAFAAERVGFLFARPSIAPVYHHLLLVVECMPVPDECYIDDFMVGARINSAAIRAALQRSLDTRMSAFHVHLHDWRAAGVRFSPIDTKEMQKLMPSFTSVAPAVPHGAIVFSAGDGAAAVVWNKGVNMPQEVKEVNIVGFPLRKLV